MPHGATYWEDNGVTDPTRDDYIFHIEYNYISKVGEDTGWPISWRTWVGLTWIWGVPSAVGRYCSYLLPKQDGGTSQI